MNKNILIALLTLAGISICMSLLILAMVTQDTTYLLAESALVHFAIAFAVLTAFESGRRNG